MADRASEIRYATIIETGLGLHTIVAAPGAGLRIVVVSLFLSSDGNVQLTWQDNAVSLMDMYLQARTPFSLSEAVAGWFRTAVDSQLDLSILQAGVNVAGVMTYRLVPEHHAY